MDNEMEKILLLHPVLEILGELAKNWGHKTSLENLPGVLVAMTSIQV